MNESFIERIYQLVAAGFEMLGALAMVAGFVIAGILAIRALSRDEGGEAAFKILRVTVGSAILLGLEILVAADLVRTITSKPSINEALILGMIVIIRTILSISIQIEIEGVLPWKKALLTSGGQVISELVKDDKARSAANKGAQAPAGSNTAS